MWGRGVGEGEWLGGGRGEQVAAEGRMREWKDEGRGEDYRSCSSKWVIRVAAGEDDWSCSSKWARVGERRRRSLFRCVHIYKHILSDIQ